jgi:hypothetical protein
MKLELLKRVPFSERIYTLTFVPGANRLLLGYGDGMTLFDATSGKELAKLPKGSRLSAMDPDGTLGLLTSDGKTVKGRWEWDVTLWDIAKGKKLAVVAKNNPDDKISPEAIGKICMLAMRKKKNACSFCLYDRAGKKVAEHRLGKVDLPFHSAMSKDERLGAHAYFTGAAHLVDLGTGKSQKLVGGALRIGRQHEKGINGLAFDPTGEYLMYSSSGSDKVHLWSTRTRKAVAGKWTSVSNVKDAFFFAGGLAITCSGRESTVTFFPLTGKSPPRIITVSEGGTLFACVGDDRHVACAGYTGYDPLAVKGLGIWDVTTGKRVAKAAQPKGMEKISAIGACHDRVALGDQKGGFALYALG